MEVVDSVDHLLHVVPADLLAESSGTVDVLVKFTAKDRFLYQVSDSSVFFTVHPLHNCCFCKLVVFYDVWVVESHGCFDLSLEILNGLRVVLCFFKVKNLDCVLFAVISVGKLHFSAETLTESLG